MGTTVRFTSGEERQYDADEAVVQDYDRLFVLHKWNRRKRKLESGRTFPADQVVWACLPDGRIVVGKGRV